MRTVLSRARYEVPISIVVFLGLVALVGLGGCGGASTTTTMAESAATTAGPTTTAAFTETTAAQAGSSEQGASGSPGSTGQPNVSALAGESGQKIIGDAVIDIEVQSGGFQSSFTNAALLADRYGGYIVTSQSSASGEEGKVDAGTIAVRVPAASFSAAVADAGKLGTLKNQRITTQDVTEEYVDLQARIINSQAKLDTFRKLYDKAATINDIVNVQGVVTAAQDELEKLKGRQRFLQEHTSYSTLTINIREAGAEPVTTTTTTKAPWGVGKAFGDAAHNFVKAVNAIVRALGILIPVLVIVAIIVYVALRWRRRSRRHGEPASQSFAVNAAVPPAPAAVPPTPGGEAEAGSKPEATSTEPGSRR
jgi:hypothetical protein